MSSEQSSEVTKQDVEDIQTRIERIMEILASDHPNAPIELQLQHINASLGGDREDIYPDDWGVE